MATAFGNGRVVKQAIQLPVQRKDKNKAEQFYKEAMDFGIKRAEKHYKRLKKENRGFFKK